MEEFLNALGLRESANNYQAVNDYGYLGRYQFGPQALQDLGYVAYTPQNVFGKYQFVGKDSIWSPHDFLYSPAVQEKAAKEWFQLLWNRIVAMGLDKYVGQTYAGIQITPSGLLAAAHLGGVGGLKRLLEQGINPSDAYGTTISSYLTTFSGFPIDFIDQKPQQQEAKHDVEPEKGPVRDLVTQIIDLIRSS